MVTVHNTPFTGSMGGQSTSATLMYVWNKIHTLNLIDTPSKFMTPLNFFLRAVKSQTFHVAPTLEISRLCYERALSTRNRFSFLQHKL